MDPRAMHPSQLAPQLRVPMQQPLSLPLPPPPAPALEMQAVNAMQQHMPQLPVDYRLLLLSLADQYVGEAHAQAALIAYNQPGASTDTYCKLMAAGLGCYEAVLKKHRVGLQPQQEALIQLRYASLLFQATSNDFDAEQLLSKAIPFCDRNRLLDIKYSMQHLLVRIMFRSRPKAAFKYLDDLVNDVVTCQHIVWVYAFRFLRVSLSLQLGNPHDMHAALQNLQGIVNLAQRNGDSAVSAAAALLEATTRLRMRNVDSIGEAQTALASARASLMQQKEGEVRQLHILLHYLDIACSLDPFEATQSKAKMERMQEVLDNMLDTHSTWSKDGTIPIPIKNSAGGSLTVNTGGIFSKTSDGHDALSLSWLPRLEVYLLAFILSAVATTNQTDNARSLKFLELGLEVCEDKFQFAESCRTKSLVAALQSARWRKLAECHLLMYLIVSNCRDSHWSQAQSNLQKLLRTLETTGLDPTEDQRRFATYLTGLVQHCTGDLDAALASYSNPIIALPPLNDKNSSYIHQELAILAKMNTLVIVRPPAHPSHNLIPSILESLSLYFPTSTNAPPSTISQNSHLVAAYAFLQTILSPHAILDTKSHLRRSLNAAKKAMNRQLIALGSAYLYSFMFTGIIGDEAMKYAKAAQATAKSAGNKTWMCVSDGLLAGALELEGSRDAAAAVRSEGEALVLFLPAGLRGVES